MNSFLSVIFKIQFFPELELKITSKFGSFGLSESTDQRVLVLSGNTNELNEKLTNLRYKNQMYDARKYTDLVTLWIKGFPALHFEIQIRREQLEVLQVLIILFDVVDGCW